MLSRQTVDQVKAFTDIISIISDYIPLKRKGRNFVGFCPFHSEKTPSFTVSPDKLIWHCFGCHESGDLIAFVRKIDNLSFVEAVTVIAKKIGVEVTEDETSPFITQEEKDFKQVRDILFSIRDYFEAALLHASSAKSYFLDRGLTERTIKEFHLGYAPDTNDLVPLLIQQGFSERNIQRTGVFYLNQAGQLELRFRGRVIYPIIDYQGRTVGFGGRIFSQIDTALAKYINSEETPFFNKRKLLFGLSLATQSIREKGFAILMEGYMDVIMAHQFGFKNTVGSMGTALTEDHIQKLKRFTRTVYLAMDSDAAGQKAIERSLELLRKYEFNIFIVHYDAKDPADFLMQNGQDAFSEILKKAQSYIDYMYLQAKKRYGMSSIELKSRIIGEIIPLLKKETDPIIQSHYVKNIAKDLGVDFELILARLKKVDNMSTLKRIDTFNRQKDRFQKAEEILIYLMATDLEKRARILESLTIDEWHDDKIRSLVSFIQNSSLTNNELVDICNSEDQSLLAKIIIEGPEKQYHLENTDACIQLVKDYQKKQRMDYLQQKIKVLEKEVDQEAEILKLLQEMNQLRK